MRLDKVRRAAMRITKLETFLVKPRWLFLRIHIDEGLTGLGEPIVEGRAPTVGQAVAELEPYLLGKDGYIELPAGPGLGIELDEEPMAGKLGHDWRNPEICHPDDGAAIDW